MDSELQGYLIGHATPALIKATLFFLALAGLGMNFYRVQKAVRSKDTTPAKFSLWYFINDTWKKLAYTVIFSLIGLRAVFLFEYSSAEIPIALSIIVGFLADRLGEIFTKVRDKSFDAVNDKIDEMAKFKKPSAPKDNELNK